MLRKNIWLESKFVIEGKKVASYCYISSKA
jgi:hypothetical protein